jgi:hypothetical protein
MELGKASKGMCLWPIGLELKPFGVSVPKGKANNL